MNRKVILAIGAGLLALTVLQFIVFRRPGSLAAPASKADEETDAVRLRSQLDLAKRQEAKLQAQKESPVWETPLQTNDELQGSKAEKEKPARQEAPVPKIAPEPSPLKQQKLWEQMLLAKREEVESLEKLVRTAETHEIVRKDCQTLVDGRLLFEPAKTMRQGQAYPMYARLTRNPRVNITEGLNGTQFTIVSEKVSCKVAMSLDSEEPRAFVIEKQPPDRKDEQFLVADGLSQWDWRVTPKRNGVLHLLLYVTPMLYVDGIGEGLKEFRQPARVITVSPDYVYASRTFLNENWPTISGLLTAILVPLFLWFRAGIIDLFRKRFQKAEVFYELPPRDGR